MPRLPSFLEPAFPVLKRGHRFATRRVGAVTRRAAARRPGPGRMPHRGTLSSAETARLEPGAVRLHVAGGAATVRRTPPVGTPAGHWATAGWGDVEVPDRYVLEIDHGLAATYNGVHVTPGGTLDYATSTYFGIEGWEEHPFFLRRRLPDVTEVDGRLLSLATRGTWGNYYHVLMDLLPRWGLFTECLPGVQPDLLLLNRNTPYARQLLELVGLGDVRFVEPTKHSAHRASTLWVPSLDNNHNEAPPWITSWLRAHLPPKETAGLPKRLYITRGDRPNTRRVIDEAEVFAALEREGFARFDPGRHPVQEQIDHFAAAEVIVAPHGAALANLNFCRPGVKVLELFAPRYLNPGYWSITSNVEDSTYRYLVGPPTTVRPGTIMNGVLDDISVTPGAVLDALDQLLTATPPTQENAP
jgi:capsular polysaccharide biosynthesis protein